MNSKLCKQDESYFVDIKLCHQSLGILNCLITAFNSYLPNLMIWKNMMKCSGK